MSIIRLFWKQFIYFFLSAGSLLTSCGARLDRIDVYSLRLGGAPVFGKLSPLLEAVGLPDSVTYYSYEHRMSVTEIITNRDSLNSLAKEMGMIRLLYEGFEVEVSANYITLESIDFSQTKHPLHYKDNIIFDSNFTVENFKNMFPASFPQTQLMDIGASFYQMNKAKKESIVSDLSDSRLTDLSLESFLVQRKSKYDPFATPMVEFTFQHDHLLAIVFLNF